MMRFFEDTDFMRSNPNRIDLYSVSLLDVGKSNSMTRSIL